MDPQVESQLFNKPRPKRRRDAVATKTLLIKTTKRRSTWTQLQSAATEGSAPENQPRPHARHKQLEVAPVIVKQNRYCELTGDTPDAVHMRRRRGEWIDDRHSHLISGRRLWINLPEVNAWLRSNGLQAN